jgi:hypothetical protein
VSYFTSPVTDKNASLPINSMLFIGIDAFLSVLSKFFLHLVNFSTGDIHKNFLSSGGFHENWCNKSYTLLGGHK